jgi:predicted dehydrogenase
MIDLFAEISEECRLVIPAEHHRGVAVIGAGGIVEGAHLPAYQRAGLPVVGITDLDAARAQRVAEAFGIPRVYESVDALLADPAVEVVDIAVPAAAQPAIFRAAIGAGKHVLAQKPFALDPETAGELSELATASGLVAAVNQQMRYDEGIAAAHRMVAKGWIGEVTGFTITVNLATPWELWEWAQPMERLEVMVHSIHYHDVVRWFLGEPESVYAVGGRTPGQYPVGETRTATTYRFASGAIALVHANHVNRGDDNYAEFRIDGVDGAIRGTIGLLYDYPDGRTDTVEVRSRTLPTDGWVPYPVTQRWIPDAFIGTMGSVLAAITTGEKPLTSVTDNVRTIDLIDAIYQSMSDNSVVRLSG